MTTAAESEKPDLFIEYAIRMTKGRIRVLSLASAVFLMLTVAAVFLLGVVLADHFFNLSSLVRAVLRWTFALVEAVLAGMTIVYPLARRLSDLYVARLIEKAHPQFRNDLTAAIELQRDGNVAIAPLSAIRRRAANEVNHVDLNHAVTSKRVKWSGILFGLAALLFVVYCIAAPKSVLPSLMRAFGNDSVQAATITQIVSLSPAGGSTVVSEQTVNFLAEVRHPQGNVILRISRDGGTNWLALDSMAMQPAGTGPGGVGRFSAAWKAGADEKGRAAVEVSCNDAPVFRAALTVLPRPAFRKISATLKYPAYTNCPDQTLDLGAGGSTVTALVGTQVLLSATANQQVERARVEFASSRRASVDVLGMEMSTQFGVIGDDRYRLCFDGKQARVSGESMWFDIKARADSAPTVRLSAPARSVSLASNETLRIAGEAMDDFGIVSLRLVCSSGGKAMAPVDLGRFSPAVLRRTIDSSLAVNKLGQPGQKLTCWIEARDACPPVGQIGKSDTFELTIRPPDEQIIAQKKAEDDAAKNQEQQERATTQPAGQGQMAAAADNKNDKANPVKDLLDKMQQDAKPLDAIRDRFDKKEQPQDAGAAAKSPEAGKANQDQAAGQQGQQQGQQNQPGAQGQNAQAGQDPQNQQGAQQAGQQVASQPAGQQNAQQPGQAQQGQQAAGQQGTQQSGQQNAQQPGQNQQGAQQQGQAQGQQGAQAGQNPQGQQAAGQQGAQQAGQQNAQQPGQNQQGAQQQGQAQQGQPAQGQQGAQQAGQNQQGAQPGQAQQGQQAQGQQGQQAAGQQGQQQAGQQGAQQPGQNQQGAQQQGQAQQGQQAQGQQGAQAAGQQAGQQPGQNQQGQGQQDAQAGQNQQGEQAAGQQGQQAGQNQQGQPGQGQQGAQQAGQQGAQPGQQAGQQAGQQPGQGQQGQQAGQQPGEGQGQGQGQGQQGQGQQAGNNGAQGFHDTLTGGDPDSGSSDHRGQVDVPDKINISPVQASQLQSLGRALDEAQKELRGGKVDDELLKQIGMTPPQYQSFVESYSQLFGKVKPLLAVTERPTATVNNAFFAPGTQQVQTGKGLDSKLGVSGTEKLTGDQMKKLNESRAARVSPEYRKSVDAYFRSVSEGSAPPSPASGPAR